MNNSSDRALVLTRIRNCYTSIRMLTLDCLSSDDPEQVPMLMRNREELIGIIACEEAKISGAPVQESALQKLRNDIASIIASIRILDNQLGVFIRGTLDSLSSEMARLYKNGRAASAYAGQSRG